MLTGRQFSPLAARRRGFGITQETLAHHVGISAPQISKIENGIHLPDRTIKERIAAALDCAVDVIFPPEDGQRGQ